MAASPSLRLLETRGVNFNPVLKAIASLLKVRVKRNIFRKTLSNLLWEIAALDHDSVNHSNKEDYFPSVEELCQAEFPRRNTKGTRQRLEDPSSDTSERCQAQQRLESIVGDNGGTRGMDDGRLSL
jgi:hypothetical protein